MAAKTGRNGAKGTGGLSSVVALAAFVSVAIGAWRRPPARPSGQLESPEPVKPAKPLLRKIDAWQRRQPVVGFLYAVMKKFGDDRAGYLAALVSYFAFFSIFPLLLALTSILGFVLQDDPALQDRIAGSALQQIPVVGDQVANNIGSLTGSTLAIVLGLATAIWSGLRVVDAAQNALNDVWDVPATGRPKLVKRRLKGIGMLAVLGFSLIGSLVATGLAGLLPDLPGVGQFGIYFLTLLLNVGIFLVAFKLLAEIRHTWGELLPGSVVAAVGWFALQAFGTGYMARTLGNAKGVYKDFGGVIALLTFFFIASQITIIGAEVNVVLRRKLWPRSLIATAGHLTDADRRALAGYVEAQRRVPTQIVRTDFATVADPPS